MKKISEDGKSNILNYIDLSPNKLFNQMEEQSDNSNKIKLYLWYTVYLNSKQKILTKLYSKEKDEKSYAYNIKSFTILDYLFIAGVKIKLIDKISETSNEIPIIIENINEYGIRLEKGTLIGFIDIKNANINLADSQFLKKKGEEEMD